MTPPDWIFSTRDLGATAKVVASVLWLHARPDRLEVWPTIDALAVACGMPTRCVTRALSELEDALRLANKTDYGPVEELSWITFAE